MSPLPFTDGRMNQQQLKKLRGMGDEEIRDCMVLVRDQIRQAYLKNNLNIITPLLAWERDLADELQRRTWKREHNRR